MITQRNISPGDYLQPGGGNNGRPLFVLEQIDPVRVFMGVPELASYFVHDQDTAVIRFQAIPGVTREGKVVRSGFSLNPSTRTLQTEIDLPNSDGHLHPGWYVTVSITIDRKQVWTLPSNAIGFQGGQNYFVYFQVDGKPVRTPVIVGPNDDTHTEVLRKYLANASTIDWPDFRWDRARYSWATWIRWPPPPLRLSLHLPLRRRAAADLPTCNQARVGRLTCPRWPAAAGFFALTATPLTLVASMTCWPRGISAADPSAVSWSATFSPACFMPSGPR